MNNLTASACSTAGMKSALDVGGLLDAGTCIDCHGEKKGEV